MTTTHATLHFFLAGATAIVIACSSSAPGSAGTTDCAATGTCSDNNNSSSSSSSFSCCINQVFYACADKASFDKCAGFDWAACDMACSPQDFACHESCANKASAATHDPSACKQQAGSCPSTPSTPPPGGSCNVAGTSSCQIDSDCHLANNHCTSGKCYSNRAGSKCDIDSDCGGGNHCTSACCLSNQAGNACNIDSDCGKGNHCTSGKCYANAFGSPCNIDSDCGSNHSCVNGKCN